MMEYPFLQSYHLKHSEYLEVVTVMVANDQDQLLISWNGTVMNGRPYTLIDQT